MATSKKHSHSKDDDKPKEHKHKKGKDIKPLHEDALKKQMAKDSKEQSAANADMLEELAKRTAELAEQIDGQEQPSAKVLSLDDDKEPADIFNELDEEIKESISTTRRKVESDEANPAADLIREKLNSLYTKEPNAEVEAAEAKAIKKHRSKHQQFMYELTTSGKSLADIQTKWHEYYVALPDDEKHDVWQEFYSNQNAVSAYHKSIQPAVNPKPQKKADHLSEHRSAAGNKVKNVKDKVAHKVSAGGKLKTVHHIKSLAFGLGMALLFGLVTSFIFFNEVYIAPFISPSKSVSATPIIGELDEEISNDPKIIIPKINLEVPVVYGLNTVEEDAIQNALENGVVHYAASPEPGEKGNVVIVGHSSNNILNSGKYKFAFVLLKRLEVDDTFFIHKDGIRYTYKIYKKHIVEPTDVEVLGDAERENSITLITCDPPGTSLRRLIVVAEQITPDPEENVEATPEVEVIPEDDQLPSNAPSLWSRLNPFD